MRYFIILFFLFSCSKSEKPKIVITEKPNEEEIDILGINPCSRYGEDVKKCIIRNIPECSVMDSDPEKAGSAIGAKCNIEVRRGLCRDEKIIETVQRVVDEIDFQQVCSSRTQPIPKT